MSGGTAQGTFAALRRTLRAAPALRRGAVVTILLAAAGTALQLVVPVLLQRIVDRDLLVAGRIDAAGAVRDGSLGLLAMGTAALARRAALYRLGRASAMGLHDLRIFAFDHLQHLSLPHLEAERRGAMVARVTSDIYRIQDFMDWGGVEMLVGTAQVALAIGAMLLYRWQLAVLVVMGVAVYALLLVWFQRILGRAHDNVRERVADSLSAMGESISGVSVVRAYGVEEPTLAKVRTALDDQFRAEFRTSTLGSVLFSSAEVFAGAITAAVIAAGVLLGRGAGITTGTLLAFLFLVNLLVQPVQSLVETIDVAQAAAAGMRRVLRLLDTPFEVADPVDGVDLPEGPLAVAARGIHYRYPDGDIDVLEGVTVELPAGSRVAVVGETGSGKTTFAKLVVRLLDPTEGVMEVGGVDVSRVRFASLRRRVAYVPQEGFLFDASIGDNIRYGRSEGSDAAAMEAVSDLGLEAWLSGLPEGLDTMAGERGGRLSAGERQLVALVRAWMTDPDLLVLDEATSAVDPALDMQLRRAMDRLIAGRTSITIAHRLSTAEASDLVLVFHEGRLVERGTHTELIAAGGTYAGLHADWMVGAATRR